MATERHQITIQEAITYLREESEWGKASIPEGSQGDIGAAFELRQAALDKNIRIFGRKEMSWGSISEFRNVWEEISHEFWKTNDLDLPAILISGAHRQKAETRPENVNDPTSAQKPNYAGLRVVKAEIESRWPKTSVVIQEKAPRQKITSRARKWLKDTAGVLNDVNTIFLTLPVIAAAIIGAALGAYEFFWSEPENDVSTVTPTVLEAEQNGSAELAEPPRPKSPVIPVAAPKMTKDQLKRMINESVSIIYDVQVSTIRESMNFYEDFSPEEHDVPGIGDLRLVELVIRIEAFGQCTIEDDVAETIRTVGDMIAVAAPRCAQPE